MDDHGVLEANEAVVFEVRTHCRGVTQILNPIFLGIEWIVLVGIFVLGGLVGWWVGGWWVGR